MNKSFLLIPCFLVFALACLPRAYGQFLELDQAIAKAGQYDRQKEKKIELLKGSLPNKQGEELFHQYEQLYDEYASFNYDSAYIYALKQLTLAKRLQSSKQVYAARIHLGFVLVSAGLFKEAMDTLQVVSPQVLTEGDRMEYYTLMARYFYDLADYTLDHYHSPWYNELGNRYLDSALAGPASPFEWAYYSGLRDIRSGNIEAARAHLTALIRTPGLTLHQEALAASTLSDIYIQTGQIDSALTLLSRAAVDDIQSSTKETSAIFNLSTLLFKKGDLKNASAYIEKAVQDALYYGARQRKVQMSAILPLIEGEKIARVESEKRTLITYAVLVTLVLLLLVFLTYIIAKQNQKLKTAQKALTEAHQEQQQLNEQLQAINAQLTEANKIKEEYIGFFFNSNTSFYEKIERFKRKVEQKLAEGKPEELLFLLRNLHLKEEREELLKNFDAIFLKIFPRFIDAFHALFPEEDRTQLKENEVLNTELRIFALIRLGIQDSDKIAAILGYSVNTINTYKTRIKNRSLVPNELFEEQIMAIRSV